jgi:hypothetical protein
MKKQRPTIVQFASQKAALHDGNIATMKPTNGTKLLSLAAAVLLTDTCMASTVVVGSLTQFTGAGAGQGIVLAPSKDIVYALNLGGPDLSIQGQTFTGATVGAPPTGVSVTGGGGLSTTMLQPIRLRFCRPTTVPILPTVKIWIRC